MRDPKARVRIEDLDESNIEDLIYVCSSKRLEDPIHRQGMNLKRQWLQEMLREYGSCAKVAYYDDKPAAQILYFPEEAEKTKASRRENVLVINCIYNPTFETQKLGIGKKLLESVIEDARHRRSCMGKHPCRFILAKAFNTGEFLPLPSFYEKFGFTPTAEKENILCLPIEGRYEPVQPVGDYAPLEEDKGRAIVFYGSNCQFSYPFAKAIESMIREVAPKVRVEMINEWENPRESIKRKNWWLTVNAKPIHTFFMDREKFKEEVRGAIG